MIPKSQMYLGARIVENDPEEETPVVPYKGTVTAIEETGKGELDYFVYIRLDDESMKQKRISLCCQDNIITCLPWTIDLEEKQKIQQSILCGVVIGFICGFVGAGGGMMLLLVLTSVLGYELKTAVGTSVFIMTFTALTGAISHFYIGGAPDIPILIACVISTLVFAQIGAKWANGANVKMLNRVTGILLCALGLVMLFF